MHLHFYTSSDAISDFDSGLEDRIYVWVKENKSPYDVHVSFNVDEYHMEKDKATKGKYFVTVKDKPMFFNYKE